MLKMKNLGVQWKQNIRIYQQAVKDTWFIYYPQEGMKLSSSLSILCHGGALGWGHQVTKLSQADLSMELAITFIFVQLLKIRPYIDI